MNFHISHDVGVWMAAFLTLCIFSFLYKDNPLYKFAEHLFIGVSAGYCFVYQYQNVFLPNLWYKIFPGANQRGEYILIIPGLLGIFMLCRLIPKVSWISRWSLAFIVGITAGITIYSYTQGQVVAQMKATMLPLFIPGSWLVSLNNILLAFGVICGLIYFYFSKPHKGIVFGAGSRIGIWFLMVSFGASFGYTVMARVSLLIGRMQFLLGDWLGLIK